MTVRPQKPWGGVIEWLDNAPGAEHARCDCLEQAAECEARGDAVAAHTYRELADINRRLRDRYHRLGLDRRRRAARARR